MLPKSNTDAITRLQDELRQAQDRERQLQMQIDGMYNDTELRKRAFV